MLIELVDGFLKRSIDQTTAKIIAKNKKLWLRVKNEIESEFNYKHGGIQISCFGN